MRGLIYGLALALALGAADARAATLDFVAEAAGNERGVVNGTKITFDGLDVTFTSSHYAYFDDLSGGKPAGLGVCKVLTNPKKQCNPSNDDNVTTGESVTLTFDTIVDFMVTSFYDADHKVLKDMRTLLIGTDGGAGVEYTFAGALAKTFGSIKSVTFIFGGTKADQFYIGAATATPVVPLPAGVLLLLTGIGGLGLVRMRKRAA